MKRFLLLPILIVFIFSASLYADVDMRTVLSSKQYSIAGTFGQHDFDDADSAFDWAFTLSNGTSYQLQGNPPSENDAFGWKKADITAPKPQWYMFPLGEDIDGDGSQKFDWILVGVNFKAVYKLAGVTDSGNFKYSDPIELDYSMNGMEVVFEDIGGSPTPSGAIETTAKISSSADAKEWTVGISFGAPGLITYKSSTSVIEHPLYFQGIWNAMISYNSNDIYFNDTIMKNMVIDSEDALNTSEMVEFGIVLVRYKDLSNS